MRPLVSIITACYNGSRFLERYSKSLLCQTYAPLEVIFVDDGSEDDTRAHVQEYVPFFRAKGILFHYFHQKNLGQAAATNVGLEAVHGDYFALFDVDDSMEPDCIERRVDFLESHVDCGFVRSDAWKIYEETPERRMRFLNRATDTEANIFQEVLRNEISAFPIFFLFRAKSFFSLYPDKRIYSSRYTQDVQVVLPMAYSYACGYIRECLACYWHHSDSHSHAPKKTEQKLALWSGWENVWIHVLREMDIPSDEREKYETVVRERFSQEKQFWLLANLWTNLLHLPEHCRRTEYYIFGASNEGRTTAMLLRKKRLKIKVFLDNDVTKHGLTVDEILVEGPEFIAGNRDWTDKKILLASSAYRQELIDQMKKMSIPDSAWLYYKDFFYQNVGDGMGWSTHGA